MQAATSVSSFCLDQDQKVSYVKTDTPIFTCIYHNHVTMYICMQCTLVKQVDPEGDIVCLGN